MAKVILSVLLLGIVLRSVEPGTFIRTLQIINLLPFVISILMFFPAQLLAAFRWYHLLRRIDRAPPFWTVVRHNLLGQFSALFLPGQISGDIVRTVAVSTGQDRKHALVLSVLIDKTILMAALTLFSF